MEDKVIYILERPKSFFESTQKGGNTWYGIKSHMTCCNSELSLHLLRLAFGESSFLNTSFLFSSLLRICSNKGTEYDSSDNFKTQYH